jgi:biopolymer transport protein ExbB/TolQ
MSTSLEALMFQLSQLFLIPVLLLVALVFAYAFWALGAFTWQWLQRRGDGDDGRELLQAWAADPGLTQTELEALALKRMELGRIASRVAPMLGLVATMIPIGPALKSLADGQLADMAELLMVAFSAVILALIAASITFAIVHVRRRWYAQDLLAIARCRDGAPQGATVSCIAGARRAASAEVTA